MHTSVPATPGQRPSWWRHWLRSGLRVVLVYFATSVVLDVAWKVQHPAPLGRSVAAAERTLARELPDGTPLSVATAYLRAQGVEFAVHHADERRTLEGVTRYVNGGLFMSESISIRLEFDAGWRLTRRHARLELSGT